MKIVNKISEIREIIKSAKRDGKNIGFVPTMGGLHEGHLTLVKEAKKIADFVIVSIFVNPKQFGKNEDLERYPRDLDGDSQKLISVDTDILFYPQVKEIYPQNYQTNVSLSKITKGLCGDKREGHFDGVSTIVLKLFNIVSPDIAFFGLKDYQQYVLIEQMVKDLNLPIEVKGIDIIREKDGLAMSSRNFNLTKSGRKRAGLISEVLKEAVLSYKNDIKNFKNSDFVIKFIKNKLENNGFIIDYIEIREKFTLMNMKEINENSMIFTAVFVDNVRLIDNFFYGDK